MSSQIEQYVKAFGTYMFSHPQQGPTNVHVSHWSHYGLFWSRLFAFGYLSGIYLWSLVEMPSLLSNVIYLTMQGYYVTWAYFGLSLTDYLLNGRGHRAISANLKYYVEIFHEVGICSEVPITIVFWGFLFRYLVEADGVTTAQIIMNANLHAGPIICLAIDYSLNSFSFPIRHLHFLLFFGALYLAINLSYSLSVKVIYAPIDWVSLLSYVLVLSSFLLVGGTHIGCRYIYSYWKMPHLNIADQSIHLELNAEENDQNGPTNRYQAQAAPRQAPLDGQHIQRQKSEQKSESGGQ